MKRVLALAALVCVIVVSSVSAQVTALTTIPFESRANSIVLSPDDHMLAVYNNGIIYGVPPTADLNPIWLIDAQTGETLGSLSGQTDWVTDVAFNSDGSQLASFHRNGDLLLWDVAEQRLIKTIPTFTLGGGWIQFLSDDKTVLYRAGEFLVGLLDTESGAITHLFGRHVASLDEFQDQYSEFPARADLMVSAAAVSPDDQWLVTSTANDEVLRWDTSVVGGEPETLRPKSEKPAQFNIRGLTFSEDGSTLTYFDHGDDAIHVWDVVAGEELHSYAPAAAEFALAPDGVTVAWADRETNAVYLADTTSTDEPVKLLDVPENLDVAPNITSLAFTSDGKQLVVGGFHESDEKNEIYVIDLEGVA